MRWFVLVIAGCGYSADEGCEPDLAADECPRAGVACDRCTAGGETWYECGDWTSAVVSNEDASDAELERLCHCYETGDTCEAPFWGAF